MFGGLAYLPGMFGGLAYLPGLTNVVGLPGLMFGGLAYLPGLMFGGLAYLPGLMFGGLACSGLTCHPGVSMRWADIPSWG